MNIGTTMAVYFVTWWVTLFMVLPFGVKTAEEMGEVVGKGHERGAPVVAHLWRKAVINSVLAGVITAGIWWWVNSGMSL